MDETMKTERLEHMLKEIIDDWYVHMAEYPMLHKYMAASLVMNGIVAGKEGVRMDVRDGGEGAIGR